MVSTSTGGMVSLGPPVGIPWLAHREKIRIAGKRINASKEIFSLILFRFPDFIFPVPVIQYLYDCKHTNSFYITLISKVLISLNRSEPYKMYYFYRMVINRNCKDG